MIAPFPTPIVLKKDDGGFVVPKGGGETIPKKHLDDIVLQRFQSPAPSRPPSGGITSPGTGTTGGIFVGDGKTVGSSLGGGVAQPPVGDGTGSGSGGSGGGTPLDTLAGLYASLFGGGAGGGGSVDAPAVSTVPQEGGGVSSSLVIAFAVAAAAGLAVWWMTRHKHASVAG